MTPISFTANYIRDVNVLKHTKEGYSSCDVSLVEMDPFDKNDVKAMNTVDEKWKDSLTVFVTDNMESYPEYKDIMPKMHVYALTSQKYNFKNINPSKMLGVMEVTKGHKGGNKIEVLQTKPNAINDSRKPNPKYKHIGQELVRYAQKRYDNKPLYVHPAETAVEFYEKQGFTKVPGYEQFNVLWYLPDKVKKEFYA